MTEVAFLKNSVRLACVRHAASVHPEPGSNSLKFVSYPPKRLQSISELVLLFTLPRNFRFPELLCCVFSDANLRVPCFFRCLIFKVLGTFLSVRLSLSFDPSLKCSTILPLPAPFVNTFFQLFWSFFQLLLHLSGRSVTLGVIIYTLIAAVCPPALDKIPRFDIIQMQRL